MADSITLDRVTDELNQIAQVHVVKLAERESLGELNFSEIKDVLDRTIRHAAQFPSALKTVGTSPK